MNPLILVAIILCTAWTVAGCAAVFWTVRRRRAVSGALTLPVSVLKPLAGVDAELSKNLETFFEQDHPEYELIFGVEDENDPAVAVVQALCRRYPHVSARLIVHRQHRGINPKVRNLLGMVPHARYDLLLISDSNVRAPRHYVREMAETFALDGDRAGLVTNLFRGTTEKSVGAALESVQLNGFCAAGAALPTTFGEPLVIGKSMMMSRSAFERLGGFDSVSHVLAEDYVIGRMFAHAGFVVRIAPAVLDNVSGQVSLRAFFARQRRWAMLRWRLRPLAYLLEPLTSPLAVLPFAWQSFGPVALIWAASLLVARDGLGWLALRGSDRLWLPLIASPVREVAMAFVWLTAPLGKHLRWRGHRVRLSAGTFSYVCASRTQ
jgi:ceramide glucosyltransferase